MDSKELWSDVKGISFDKGVIISNVTPNIRRALSKHLLISNLFIGSFYEVACEARLLPLLFELDEEIYNFILDFNDKIRNNILLTFNDKRDTLSRVMSWKTTNPGEQMTGTFHKLVLDDRSVWYI